MKRLISIVGIVYALTGLNGATRSAIAADVFPSRPIQIVVGYPPGGVTDQIARELAPLLQRDLGQPVVITNRPGAAMIIASEVVKSSPPDGYTLLFATTAWANNPMLSKKPRYQREDFIPVALALEDYATFTAPSKSGATLAEWIKNAKSEQRSFNVATLGVTSIPRLLSERLAGAVGTKFTQVPYQGAGPAQLAVVTGEVQGYFGDFVSALPMQQAGKIQILATTRPERMPSAPNIPTFAEQGFPQLTISFWYGFLAPAATPPDIVAKLNGAVNRALNDPKLKERMERNGGSVKPVSSSEFNSIIKRDVDIWSSIIEPLNIKSDAD